MDRCAVPACRAPLIRDPTGSKGERVRLSKTICCRRHEEFHGESYRRRMRGLLIKVQEVVERAERAETEPSAMPSGAPARIEPPLPLDDDRPVKRTRMIMYASPSWWFE
jgi:hypothetical protein